MWMLSTNDVTEPTCLTACLAYLVNMNTKQKSVLDRIRHLEEAIAKAREYVASGAHADWHGFRPLFTGKQKEQVKASMTELRA